MTIYLRTHCFRYSYSKTRGLFGGVSLEGSVIVERQDANAMAYHSDVTAAQLLSGSIDPPDWAMPLIKSLEACTAMPGGRQWIQTDVGGRAKGGFDEDYAFGAGVGSPGSETPPSILKRKGKAATSHFSPHSWSSKKNSTSGSYFTSDHDNDTMKEPDQIQEHQLIDVSVPSTYDNSVTRQFETPFESDFGLIDTSTSPQNHRRLSNKPGLTSPNTVRSPILGNSNSLSSPRANSPRSPYTHGRNLSSSQSSNRFSITPDQFATTNDPYSSLLDDFPQMSILDGSTSPKAISKPRLTSKPGFDTPMRPGEGRAVALYDFIAVQVRL